MRRGSALALAAAAVALLAACTADRQPDELEENPIGERYVIVDDDLQVLVGVGIMGTLEFIDDRCLGINGDVMIAPAGTSLEYTEGEWFVQFAGHQAVRVGDRIEGSGGRLRNVDLSDRPGIDDLHGCSAGPYVEFVPE